VRLINYSFSLQNMYLKMLIWTRTLAVEIQQRWNIGQTLLRSFKDQFRTC